MKTRRINLVLQIELPETSNCFADDVRTWDLGALFGAKDGERFFFPEAVLNDETTDND